MKGKCIFSIAIVVALAVLAAAAFICSLPGITANGTPKYEIDSESEGTAVSETNMEEGFPLSLKTEENAHCIMKLLIFLASMGNIIFKQTRNENGFKIFGGTVYAIMITYFLGKWGIYRACVERGYEAVGGEYCLILIVSWAAETAISHLFNTVEAFKYDQSCRKERS